MDEDRIIDIVFIVGYLSIIILRILNIITWSWLWILCPLWLPCAGAIIGLVCGCLICIPIIIYKKIRGIKNEWY